MIRIIVLLTLGGCGAVHAANSYLSMPIVAKNLQGVQQIELNLPAIAAYQVQPSQLYVVDANQQIMPMRVTQPQQKAQLSQIALALYRWPAQAILDDPERLNQLQLQLRQGAQQATLTWPDQSLRAQGRSQSWLLASPKLSGSLQPSALLLQWRAEDFSSVVRVEGSDNLVDWQFAGLGQILQTRDASAKPLLQQRVEIKQAYPFWRLSVDQPLDLQQVSLQAYQPALPLWTTQRLTFKPLSATVNAHEGQQWQLQLPYAVAIQALQFTVPAQQLWEVKLQAKLRQQGREYWQPLAQTELYHWATSQEKPATAADSPINSGNINSNNRIELDQPIVAREWRFNLSAPQSQSDLVVEAFAPKTVLYFLAQGRAPYQLIINPNMLRQSPRLPERLNVAGRPHLGAITLQTPATSSRQYGLWVGLMLLVGVLAVAAWRLYRGLQHANSAD